MGAHEHVEHQRIQRQAQALAIARMCVLRCMPCWPTSPHYMTLLFQKELWTSGYMKPVTGKHETHQPTLDTFKKTL